MDKRQPYGSHMLKGLGKEESKRRIRRTSQKDEEKSEQAILKPSEESMPTRRVRSSIRNSSDKSSDMRSEIYECIYYM